MAHNKCTRTQLGYDLVISSQDIGSHPSIDVEGRTAFGAYANE